MGIIALKAMAKGPWTKDADRSKYKKCWYEPIDDPQLAKLALSWTLSQGVTAALPPCEEKLFRLAVEHGTNCKELTNLELAELEKTAKSLQPIFTA